MDLFAFDAEPLFFDTPPADEVVQLLQHAADHYGEEQAEADLQHAYHLAPDHLMVLVALFRYYVYQQRFREALTISQQARAVIRQPLDWPHDWRSLSATHLAGREKSGVRIRFYLLCLKGEAYLYARLGEREQAAVLLEKLIEIDTEDRLGAAALLNVVNNAEWEVDDGISISGQY